MAEPADDVSFDAEPEVVADAAFPLTEIAHVPEALVPSALAFNTGVCVD